MTAPWWTGNVEKQRRCFSTLLLLLAGCGGGEYPSRPIQLVCPWAAGGGSDRVAKQAAALLQKELRVNVDVQNVTGGEGVAGHSHGALAAPDGYTLTLMTVEINMLRWRGRTKLSHRDFAPAILLNRDAAGIFVRADAPWATLKDLEAEIRRSPGKLRGSGTAAGGIWHLALAGWLRTAGRAPTDVIWVSSQGSTPALRDLLARGIEVVCCSLPEARTLLNDGHVRCLGVMSEARHPLFPEYPTLREQGFDWSMAAWRGIGLPAATPRRILDVLVPALERVARSEDFLEYMRSEGFGAACEMPAEFEKTLERTDQRMKELLTHDSMRSLSRSAIPAMAFPSVLGAGLGAVLLGLLAARAFKGPGGAARTPGGRVRFAETIAWVVAYVVLSPYLGYLLTAAPLLFLLLWRLGSSARLSAAVSLALTAGTYVVFALVLRVSLSRGPFPL